MLNRLLYSKLWEENHEQSEQKPVQQPELELSEQKRPESKQQPEQKSEQSKPEQKTKQRSILIVADETAAQFGRLFLYFIKIYIYDILQPKNILLKGKAAYAIYAFISLYSLVKSSHVRLSSPH